MTMLLGVVVALLCVTLGKLLDLEDQDARDARHVEVLKRLHGDFQSRRSA